MVIKDALPGSASRTSGIYMGSKGKPYSAKRPASLSISGLPAGRDPNSSKKDSKFFPGDTNHNVLPGSEPVLVKPCAVPLMKLSQSPAEALDIFPSKNIPSLIFLT